MSKPKKGLHEDQQVSLDLFKNQMDHLEGKIFDFLKHKEKIENKEFYRRIDQKLIDFLKNHKTE